MKVKFDREIMTTDILSTGTQYVEGYWADPGTHSNLPKPTKHGEPWPNQGMWLRSLEWVEDRIAGHNPIDNSWEASSNGREEMRYFKYGEGTTSLCRICGRENGYREYQIKVNNIVYRWPEGYRHYVAAHNVVPSREFYYLINGLFSRLE